MAKKPVFIGLTGGVAAGKSTALAALAEAGVPTLSADAVVHRVYEDPEMIELVRGRLGDGVILNGAVDRDAVASEIFNEPELRSWLEQLIWPRVGMKIFEFRRTHEALDEPPAATVVEVPLLFEAGMDQGFDRTIAVIVDDGLRKARAAERGGEELAARDERQMSQDEKAKRADVVVVNDGDLEVLGERALAAVAQCIELGPRA
ncbi:MAG: dephospho-CoA kinase [Solirubrobacterales bacterium]|nr:dephospho-CoA kinase [Solirubrobacterales bacterium]